MKTRVKGDRVTLDCKQEEYVTILSALITYAQMGTDLDLEAIQGLIYSMITAGGNN